MSTDASRNSSSEPAKLQLRCACDDDSARSALEARVRGAVLETPSTLGGGRRHASIRALFQRMADSAAASADSSATQAAQQYAPKILRQALVAGLMPIDDMRRHLQNRTWSSALEHVHRAIEQAPPQGMRRLATDQNGYDMYEHRDAHGRLLSVIATSTGTQPRAGCRGISLTDALLAHGARQEHERENERVVARVAALLRWVRRHGTEAGLPAHPALNTGALRVGDDCVILAGWNGARLNELDYLSERPDDEIARAAVAIDKVVRAP
jgi:hypothetical protein